NGARGFCGVTGREIAAGEDDAAAAPDVSSGGTLRTYRLAMAATGEYTQFHGGTVVDGLSAIVTTMNRVNGIYEREVAVRMVLVANTDAVIFTNPATDPYANSSGDLAANQTTINNTIGAANYDIGHLVGTGGGGVAGLGVVCGGSKARGLTGSGAPVADAFDVDYVAHEMGHQFSGNHTFNGSGSNCSGGNRNGSTAYEPGSGVSIQAYAGICGGDDLQPNSEDFFHRVSLNEIIAFTTTGSGSCGAQSSTGNGVPTVATPAAFTIPGRTPFTLTATGSDPDAADTLTYHWEQFDLGPANAEGVLSETSATGPMFRSFDPVASPSRTFPSWRYILANANVVPATAPLPGTTSPAFMTGEVLPNVSRTLNFRVTVRDNRAGGGGTNEASTVVTVANTAGPFVVTAPNTAVSLAAGAATNVTWNANGTNNPPISTANVRITLSTDGGNTWPFELAASTPNDGLESVTLPAGSATTQARVRVEAVGNVFFDVSDANFTITSSNQPPTISNLAPLATRQGAPSVVGLVATVSDDQDAAGTLAVSVSGAPTELATSVQNVGGNVTLTATASCTLVAPTSGSKAYPLVLRVVDSGGAVRTAQVVVTVGANRAPTLGTYPALTMAPNSVRQLAPSTPGADADGNFLAATVTPNTIAGGGSIAIANDGLLTVTTTASTPVGTNATVRARLADACGAVEQRDVAITIAAPTAVPALGGVQVVTGNALVEPNECNTATLTVRNDGTVPMTGVSATIATATPNVTITQGTSGFPDIPPGESRTNSIPYAISTGAGLTCFSTIALNVSVAYAQSPTPFTANVNVPVGQAQGTNYVFTSSTGATIPTDGTLVAASQASEDAAVDLVVPAGFNFSIYGTAVAGGTTLRASTNGNLQLRATGGGNDQANLVLPAATNMPASAPVLFVLWDDWRMLPSDGSSAADAAIYTKLEGVAPNRSWIVEWRGRIRGDGATGVNNDRVAIVLHENSSSFDFIYAQTGVGASANGAGSTIGVQSAGTGSTFTQFAFNNANLAAGLKLTATIPPAICAPGSGGCAVVPGATLVQSGGNTSVVEGGATDTYTIALDTQPTGDVTVTATPDAQVTVAPPSLTFTTANWNAPQPITVTAVDDAVIEGPHVGVVAHAASGGGYDAVSVPSVTVGVGDNDALPDPLFQDGFE
ncbi:MAG TPA: zinc-dependent metalloprotease family protein, partial [Xanthomonadales bacterium]|nr:zinc-dependent metalloprotease family protein [Xanthomonadales bacterium]